MEWVASTLTPPPNVVYPTLLKLMRTLRLPAVDWTDAPTDLNRFVRFGERRNLVSARVPSRSARAIRLCTLRTYHSRYVPPWVPTFWSNILPLNSGGCSRFVRNFGTRVPRQRKQFDTSGAATGLLLLIMQETADCVAASDIFPCISHAFPLTTSRCHEYNTHLRFPQ